MADDSSSDEDEFFDAEGDEELHDQLVKEALVSAGEQQGGLRKPEAVWLELAEAEEKQGVAAETKPLAQWPQEELRERALGALELNLNSNFHASDVLFGRWETVDPYNAVGHACVLFLNALMTFDPEDLDRAATALSHASTLANGYRLRDGFFSRAKKEEDRTADEVHMNFEATVCCAEATMMYGIVQLCQESLASYIKGGLNFRKSYQMYMSLWSGTDLVADDDDDDDVTQSQPSSSSSSSSTSGAKVGGDNDDDNDDDGDEAAAKAKLEQVREKQTQGTQEDTADLLKKLKEPEHEALCFGLGLFNVILSFVPASLMRIVEMLGFSADREFGIRMLTRSYEAMESRSTVSALVLMIQYVVITPFVRGGRLPQEYAEHAQAVVDDLVARFPRGALVLWLKARLDRALCKLDSAVEGFTHAMSVQQEWLQLQHLCMYELGWIHALQRNFGEAVPMYRTMAEESAWSKAFYRYAQAANLVHQGKRDEAIEVLTMIPDLVRRRFAGKMIPVEKFILRRVQQAVGKKGKKKSKKSNAGDESKRLLLFPMYELLVMWNVFHQMSEENLHAVLSDVDEELEAQRAGMASGDIGTADALAVCLLIKGYVLKALDQASEAYDCFTEIQDQEEAIKEELHTVPFSMYASGIIQMEVGNHAEARVVFDTAKTYKDFDFENRCQMRLFNALTRLDEMGV